MNQRQKTYVIISAYNESTVVRSVLEKVLAKFEHVICVDDGSRDATAIEIAKTKALIVRHCINMGAGAGIQTGVDFALQDPEAAYFILFDADGQHSVEDATRMLQRLKTDDLDIVIGSRFLGKEAKAMPTVKRFLLKAAAWFSYITSGVRLSDSHVGLRVFNRRFAEKLQLTMPDFAHASELVHRIVEHQFAFAEEPVTITYTDYSRRKGQPVINAINIAFDVLLNKVTKK